MATGPDRCQRGFALIAVLWLLLLLAGLAVSYGHSSRTEAYLARNALESAKAEALADAAVHRAVFGLLQGSEAGGLTGDGTVYTWRLGEGEIRFAIRDEAAKLDLNLANAEELNDLLVTLGLDETESETLADAIIDFRDEDDEAAPNGAEDIDYKRAGLPWGAKDAPFALVEELEQVIGMSGPLFRQIEPLVTVYSGMEPFNWSADSGGFSPETASRANDRDFGTADPSIGASDLGSRLAATTNDPSVLEQGLGTEGFGGDLFAIHAEARLPSGAVFVRDAVVRLTDDGIDAFRVYRWRRGRRTLFPLDGLDPIGAPPH